MTTSSCPLPVVRAIVFDPYVDHTRISNDDAHTRRAHAISVALLKAMDDDGLGYLWHSYLDWYCPDSVNSGEGTAFAGCHDAYSGEKLEPDMYISLFRGEDGVLRADVYAYTSCGAGAHFATVKVEHPLCKDCPWRDQSLLDMCKICEAAI